MAAIDEQAGGDHYRDMEIQPIEFIHGNNLPFLEGNVVKYISRYRSKGGAADLRKAKHCIELLLELEYGESDESRGAAQDAIEDAANWLLERIRDCIQTAKDDGYEPKRLWMHPVHWFVLQHSSNLYQAHAHQTKGATCLYGCDVIINSEREHDVVLSAKWRSYRTLTHEKYGIHAPIDNLDMWREPPTED